VDFTDFHRDVADNEREESVKSGAFWDCFNPICYRNRRGGLSVKPDLGNVSFRALSHAEKFYELWQNIERGERNEKIYDAARDRLTRMAEAVERNPKMNILARGMRKFYGAQLGWMEAGLPVDEDALERIRNKCVYELAVWKRMHEIAVEDYKPDIMGGLPPQPGDPWSDAYRKILEEDFRANASQGLSFAAYPDPVGPNPYACAGKDLGGDLMKCVGQEVAGPYGVFRTNPIIDAGAEATKQGEYPAMSNANIAEKYDSVASRHPEVAAGEPFVQPLYGTDKMARDAEKAAQATKNAKTGSVDFWEGINKWYAAFSAALIAALSTVGAAVYFDSQGEHDSGGNDAGNDVTPSDFGPAISLEDPAGTVGLVHVDPHSVSVSSFSKTKFTYDSESTGEHRSELSDGGYRKADLAREPDYYQYVSFSDGSYVRIGGETWPAQEALSHAQKFGDFDVKGEKLWSQQGIVGGEVVNEDIIRVKEIADA